MGVADAPDRQIAPAASNAEEITRSLRQLFATAATPDAFFEGLSAFAVELRQAGQMPLRSLVRSLARAAVAEAYLETLHEVRSLLSGIWSSVDVGAELVREIFAGRGATAAQPQQIADLLDCIDDARVAADHAVQLAEGAMAVREAQPARLRRCVEIAVRITRRGRRDAVPAIRGEIPDAITGPAAGEVLQVLLNLLRNAQDAVLHRPDAEVAVRAWAAGGMAYVCVEDNGAGFTDPRPRPRGAPRRSSKPGGAGVGLSICRALVESWGATLEIESRDGEGARVIFGVPIADA